MSESQDQPTNPQNVFDLSTRRGRNAARKATRAAAARQRAADRQQVRDEREAHRCQAIARSRGNQCKSRAITTAEDPTDGQVKRLCSFHASDMEQQRIMMEQARAVRGMRHAKPHELMRTIVESNPILFMQPYLDSLGIRIVFVPDPADPSILHPTAVADPSSQGTTLFGVSKDGHVIVSKHKDIEAQQRAAERLFDRVYGKPKQTTIVAGAQDTDHEHIVPFDDKRQAEIAAILEAAKKPSHQLSPEQLN